MSEFSTRAARLCGSERRALVRAAARAGPCYCAELSARAEEERMEAQESLETYLDALAEFASDNDASAVEVFNLDWEFEDAEEAHEFHFWVGYVTCAAEFREQRPSKLLADHMQKEEASTCLTTTK